MRFGTDAALVTDGERLLGIVTPPTWSAPSPPMREVGCPPPRARGDDHERCPTTDLNAMTISSVDRRSVRTSVELATRALSIRISQSWRWRLGTRTVHLYADRQRHLAATDADGRDLVVSCGTASDDILSRVAGRGGVERGPPARDPARPGDLPAQPTARAHQYPDGGARSRPRWLDDPAAGVASPALRGTHRLLPRTREPSGPTANGVNAVRLVVTSWQ
jgi:hypothetical protein